MLPSPPAGSQISVRETEGDPTIVIPGQPGGLARYGVGVFVFAWLGGWLFGFRSAATQLLSGAGTAQGFLIFWLIAWTVGGLFALYYLFRVLRPPVPETLTLKYGSVLYDSGIPVFQMYWGGRYGDQRQAWKALFPKRTIVEIDRGQLGSLRLRETDSGNRLTVDANAARLDLATGASEVEREWLYKLLANRYSLPAPTT